MEFATTKNFIRDIAKETGNFLNEEKYGIIANELIEKNSKCPMSFQTRSEMVKERLNSMRKELVENRKKKKSWKYFSDKNSECTSQSLSHFLSNSDSKEEADNVKSTFEKASFHSKKEEEDIDERIMKHFNAANQPLIAYKPPPQQDPNYNPLSSNADSRPGEESSDIKRIKNLLSKRPSAPEEKSQNENSNDGEFFFIFNEELPEIAQLEEKFNNISKKSGVVVKGLGAVFKVSYDSSKVEKKKVQSLVESFESI